MTTHLNQTLELPFPLGKLKPQVLALWPRQIPSLSIWIEVLKYPLLTRRNRTCQTLFWNEGSCCRSTPSHFWTFYLSLKIAAEYSSLGPRLIDLIQRGNMGLDACCSWIQSMKGARLITYAVWWIRGYIQEYLMKQYSLVKIELLITRRNFYQLQREKKSRCPWWKSRHWSHRKNVWAFPADEVYPCRKIKRSRSQPEPTFRRWLKNIDVGFFKRLNPWILMINLAHEEIKSFTKNWCWNSPFIEWEKNSFGRTSSEWWTSDFARDWLEKMQDYPRAVHPGRSSIDE